MIASKRGGLLLPVLLLILVAGLIGGALKIHLVRTSEGHKLYVKKQPTLTDTWVDVTTWKAANLREHPDLVETMIKAGDARLLPGGPVLTRLYLLGNDINKALAGFEREMQSGVEKLKQEADKLNQWLQKQ